MKKYFLLFCLIQVIYNQNLFAQKVSFVDGSKIAISLDGTDLQVNKKYLVINPTGQRKGIIQITSTDEIDSAQGNLLKGVAQSGWSIKPIESSKVGSTNSQQKKKSEKMDRHFSHGLVGGLFSGTVTSTGAVSDGFGGSTSFSTKLDMSGLGLGYEYNYWISDLSLGADFRYESYSLKGEGGSASGTLYKIGITGGYLLPDFGLKFNFGYCLFGSSGSSGVSALTGFKFGAQYFFTDNVAGRAEIHMINSTAASSGDGSTQTSTMSLNTTHLGVGYYF